MNEIISLDNVTFGYEKETVLENLDMKIYEGDLIGIMGENGAGKTTLMNILYGLYSPNSGEIYINSNKYTHMTPKIAVESGIGMVHQHFMLIEPFSVIQNIVLGTEDTKGLFIDLEKSRKKVLSIIEKYGFSIDLDSKIQDITVGSQQKVEILKALYKGAEIIIFDEPTAVLTPQEIDEFKFNTSIAQLMILVNALSEAEKLSKSTFEKLVMLIAPFAPHLAEEFWNLLGNQFSIFTRGKWPEYDEKLLVSSEVTLAVQFNGKMRGTLQIAADARQEEVLDLIKKDEKLNAHLI